MASILIEPNLDGDATLPGGRGVVHRLSIVLDQADLDRLAFKAEPITANVALPNITVRHLFLTVKRADA